jgi:endo-1,4-beta-xylanase
MDRRTPWFLFLYLALAWLAPLPAQDAPGPPPAGNVEPDLPPTLTTPAEIQPETPTAPLPPETHPVPPAVTPPPMPPGGATVLPADPLPAGQLSQSGGDLPSGAGADAHSTAVVNAVLQQPFPNVVRLKLVTPVDMSFNAQYLIRLAQPVKKGDKLLVGFYARALGSQQETGEALLHVYVQKHTDGYPHTFDFRISLPVKDGFAYYQLPFPAEFDIAVGEGELGLGFGASKPQELEIGGLQLMNFGPGADLGRHTIAPASYEGREANSPWRAEAEKRIEEIRKAGLTVLVVDEEDKPVTDARVQVELKRHQFAFGSAVGAKALLAQGPEADRYRAMVEELFNTVTLENDLKWGPWEVGEGHPEFSRPQTLAALRWLRDRRIRVRGHVLVWPGWRNLPPRLRALESDPVALQGETLKHIREISGVTNGMIAEWDVLNEPFDNHDLMRVGGDYAMVQWFRAAREANPDTPLFINDYGILSGGGRNTRHQDHYAAVIQYLLDRGAPIQGIGLQGHFGWDLTSPKRLMEVLDRFAEFGKPLAITEFDIAMTDERLQADYMRDFMTVIFSHPAVGGFSQWGFWEGRHWKPEAALFRKDWSPKPNGEVYRELVLRNWWTRDGGPTDAQGTYRTRGFLGEYSITVDRGQSTQTVTAQLRPSGTTVTVELKP